MCFLIKKKYNDEKEFFFNDRLFVFNRNFTTEHIKIVKNSRFFEVKKNLKFQVF